MTQPTAAATNGYRVGLTADAVRPDGSFVHGDDHLGRLTGAGIAWSVLPDAADSRFVAELRDVDSVLSFGPTELDRDALIAAPWLRHIARFGAGYESIDLAACTAAGVAVTNAPGAIRRPLALAALTMLLALAHQLVAKDRLVREGGWRRGGDVPRFGIEGRTLGIIGFGGVGLMLAQLARPLGVEVIASNRRGHHPGAAAAGVDLVNTDEVLRRADYVVLCAALTPDTHRLIGAAQLQMMKSSAFLINVGRGKLIDTDALREALRSGIIAGAGLDVLDPEPPDPQDDLLGFDNVVLSPHALCWTADFTHDVWTSALEAIVDIERGRVPANLLNPAALGSDAWRARAPDAQ